MANPHPHADPTRNRAVMAALVETTAHAVADMKVDYCISVVRVMRPHLATLAADGLGQAMAMLLTDMEQHMAAAKSDSGRQPS